MTDCACQISDGSCATFLNPATKVNAILFLFVASQYLLVDASGTDNVFLGHGVSHLQCAPLLVYRFTQSGVHTLQTALQQREDFVQNIIRDS